MPNEMQSTVNNRTKDGQQDTAHGGAKNRNRRKFYRHKPKNNCPKETTPETPKKQSNDDVSVEAQEINAAPAAVETTKSEEALPPAVEIVGVRFRNNTKIYYFDPADKSYALDTHVIVETSRGIEFGTVVIANRPVPVSEIVSTPLKKVLRQASADDVARHENNRRLEKESVAVCEERIKKFGLDMKIVDVEYTFDNSKLIFYFTSEGRVDFRELVKNLASVFRTRIELRQIGIRDEAKIMGGFGSCGRPFCCSSFLSDFTQVSIRMAKEQNFSLNSSKISGTCGRLMCCLRYEHDAYDEALKHLPRNGATVSTPDGVGTVVEIRPLAEMVKVRLDEKNEAPRYYAKKDIEILRNPQKTQADEETEN